MSKQHWLIRDAMTRIKQAREAQGMSQLQAATLANMQQSDWSGFESGSKPCTLEKMCQMAKAVGLVPSEIGFKERAA